jgi:hypothetical protein
MALPYRGQAIQPSAGQDENACSSGRDPLSRSRLEIWGCRRATVRRLASASPVLAALQTRTLPLRRQRQRDRLGSRLRIGRGPTLSCDVLLSRGAAARRPCRDAPEVTEIDDFSFANASNTRRDARRPLDRHDPSKQGLFHYPERRGVEFMVGRCCSGRGPLVSRARGGRLHRPGDPRAGPRHADVTGRATASVEHRTAASRGETNGRTPPTQAVPWHDRFHHSSVVVLAMPRLR